MFEERQRQEIAVSALARLMIAGTAALLSAQAFAMQPSSRPAVTVEVAAAQQAQTSAPVDAAPEFCLAADKCAVALSADYLVRYDQYMDQLLGR